MTRTRRDPTMNHVGWNPTPKGNFGSSMDCEVSSFHTSKTDPSDFVVTNNGNAQRQNVPMITVDENGNEEDWDE